MPQKGQYTAADLAPAPQQTGAYSAADLADTPPPQQQPGFWENLGHTFGIGSQEDAARYQQFVEHPIQTMAENALGPAYLAGKGIVQQVGQTGKELYNAGSSLAHGDAPGAAIHAIGAVPLVGPAMLKMADEAPPTTPGQSWGSQVLASATPGNIGTALGIAAQVAPLLLSATDAAVPGRPTIPNPRLRNTPPIAGQNFTPVQLRARAAATAYGNASTGTIPQDLAARTGSILRDTAAQNPDAMAAINGKNPLAAVQADIDLHHAAQARIDQAHEAILSPVRNRPVDTSAIQQAVQPSPEQLQGMDPADVNIVNRMQARAANVTTLGGLNRFRQFMNTEDMTLRSNPSYAQTIGTPALVHDMANATREAYYNNLQNVTGQDFTGLKRMEGSLIQQSAGLQSALPRLSMAEARANAPVDWRNTAGDVLEGTTRSGAPGLPIVSGVATKLGEAVKGTKLAQMQRQLQTFYSDLPSQPTVSMPQGPQIAGLLQRGPIATPPPAPWDGQPTPGLSRPGMTIAPDTTPARTGRLLPAKAGYGGTLANGSQITPAYEPEMSPGTRVSALMQMLRLRGQGQLPAQATPIQLPPPR